MLRVGSLLLACALSSLVPIFPACARTRDLSATHKSSAEPTPPVDPIFRNVPGEDKNYARLQDLQQKHLLNGYPEGYFSKRQLTRYEFAIAIQRIIVTLSYQPGGMEGPVSPPKFVIPRDLPRNQAREILAAWMEFEPELEKIGVRPDRHRRIQRTLEEYLDTLPPDKAAKLQMVIMTGPHRGHNAQG